MKFSCILYSVEYKYDYKDLVIEYISKTKIKITLKNDGLICGLVYVSLDNTQKTDYAVSYLEKNIRKI